MHLLHIENFFYINERHLGTSNEPRIDRSSFLYRMAIGWETWWCHEQFLLWENCKKNVKWKIFVCTKAMSCNKSLSGVHRCKWYHQKNNMLMHFAPMTSALLKNSLSFGFIINNLIHRFNELIDIKFIRRKLRLRSSKLAEPFVNTLRDCAYIAVRPFSQYLPIELHFCNYKELWIMLS